MASDGKTLAVGGADGIIRWLDVSDRRELAVLKGHTAAVEGIAFLGSQGGKSQATCFGLGRWVSGRLWLIPAPPAVDPKSKSGSKPIEPAAILLSGHKVRCMRLLSLRMHKWCSPAAEHGGVRLWNAVDGKSKGVLTTGHTGPIKVLAVSPDGKWIATGSADKTARLVSLADPRSIRHRERSCWGRVERGLLSAWRPRGDRWG